MDLEHVKKVTVLGQGVMGPDIAICFAIAGYDVTGVDVMEEPLERAAQKISLNCEQMVEGGILTAKEAINAQDRITRTLEWERSVSCADFIMEAVPEDMETKQDVFSKCDRICSKDIIIASNTSSMSITQIATKMKYPQRAISTHWTIPAHLSPMVEVICGEKTSAATKDLAFALLTETGKKPVVCKDSPGFIHNYVQFAMVKAALDLLERQIATPEDIDTVIKNGFGLRLSSVGPIQFVDMCGLDTILNIQKYMYGITKDPVYKPSRAIVELVDKGDLGVKTGQGFYDHSETASEKFGEQTNRAIIKMRQACEEIA